VHQTLVYPITDRDFSTSSYAENGDGYLLTRHAMEWFWACYLGPEGDGRDWRASPLVAVSLHGLPPAHVITAEFDPLCDEGEAYASRLRDAAVPVTRTRYDGMIHAFFTMPELLDDGERAVADVACELRAAFEPSTST
jgi:acetyl esterase